MEMRLYQAVQKKAATLEQSFAAYVIDLLALDVAQTEPNKTDIPDVNRVRGLVKPKKKRIIPRSVDTGRDSTKSDWSGNGDGPTGKDDKHPKPKKPRLIRVDFSTGEILSRP